MQRFPNVISHETLFALSILGGYCSQKPASDSTAPRNSNSDRGQSSLNLSSHLFCLSGHPAAPSMKRTKLYD